MSWKHFAIILSLLGFAPSAVWADDARILPPVSPAPIVAKKVARKAGLGTPVVTGRDAPVAALGAPQTEMAPPPLGNYLGIPHRPSNRVYGQAEFLVWWLHGVNTPVLATADDSLAGLPAGVLGGPGTRILIGGENLSARPRQGGRFTVGYWLDCEQTWGIEGNYFFTMAGSRSVGATSSGDNTLGASTVFRPHFDALAGQESALLVAGPGTAGGMNVTTRQELYGAELNLRRTLSARDGLSVGLLAGFRFLTLDESLDISTLSIGGAGIPTLATQEGFATRNRFYGGQLGADITYQVNNALSLKLRPKLALGVNHQTANINGNAVATDAATGAILASGPATLLAQTTNIGQHNRNQFCFVPEIGVQAGYQLSRNVSLTAGYTWLYMTNVARPGEAIDRNTTAPTIGVPPGAATNPAVNWRNSNFWAQGIDLGIVIRY